MTRIARNDILGLMRLLNPVLERMGIFGQDSTCEEGGGYWLGPLLEVLFRPAAEISTETENACDHAAIDSRWIVDCTA